MLSCRGAFLESCHCLESPPDLPDLPQDLGFSTTSVNSSAWEPTPNQRNELKNPHVSLIQVAMRVAHKDIRPLFSWQRRCGLQGDLSNGCTAGLDPPSWNQPALDPEIFDARCRTHILTSPVPLKSVASPESIALQNARTRNVAACW